MWKNLLLLAAGLSVGIIGGVLALTAYEFSAAGVNDPAHDQPADQNVIHEATQAKPAPRPL